MTQKTISRRIAKTVYAIWVLRSFLIGFGLSGAAVNVITREPTWVNAFYVTALALVLPVYLLRWIALRKKYD